MRFDALKRHWDRLGRDDPFAAVLTRGVWERDEFFRSGVDEIASMLRQAEHLGLTVPRRRALDFGCGVGRLTQALAAEFAQADGVDISRSMLKAARTYDRHPDRCRYHLNTAPDLRQFPDGAFSFVYSTLVLQHMEPRYSVPYIGELLRLLASDGVLVFQVPSGHIDEAVRPSGGETRTAISGRLTPDAYRARIRTDEHERHLGAREPVTIPVTIENVSSRTWAALSDAWGRYRINLANHWRHEDGGLWQRDDARAPLPHDLAPGDRATVPLRVMTPDVDGVYWLELDLVQENVGWFAQHGSETWRVRCVVSGGTPGPAPRTVQAAAAVARVRAPFRERHPRWFQWLAATRLRTVYWTWRYGLDGIRRRRDRLIRGARARLYEPVVPPLVNWWKRRPFAARMEMHCVPRADVIAAVRAGGGRIVQTERELMPSGFESCRYWVVKD